MEYASRGAGTAGITLGTIGTALGAINTLGSGVLGNGRNGNGSTDININAPDVEVARLRAGYAMPYAAPIGVPFAGYYGGCGAPGYYGGGCGGGNHWNPVNHHELQYVERLAAKDAVITSQNAELFTNKEIGKVYAYVNQKFEDINNRFCYDEKLIEKNRCDIEKTNIDLHCNYYKMDKVIRPWDICPAVQLSTTPPTMTSVVGDIKVKADCGCGGAGHTL